MISDLLPLEQTRSVRARAVVPAAAPQRIRHRLTGPRRAVRVVHRGRDAVYLDADGWCLGVVHERASRVPCALVVQPTAALDLAQTEAAKLGRGELVLDAGGRTVVLRVGRLVDASVPRLPGPPEPPTLARLAALATPAVDELGADLAPVIRREPRTLLGRGSGLTPLGDDVLAGWAATAHALGRPVGPADWPDPREFTTLLSATLVDCARRGEVLPEFRNLVGALRRRGQTQVEWVDRAARALVGVGHTSGAGLLLGACLRLQEGQT